MQKYNHRMEIQNGHFLYPLYSKVSFMQNLFLFPSTQDLFNILLNPSRYFDPLWNNIDKIDIFQIKYPSLWNEQILTILYDMTEISKDKLFGKNSFYKDDPFLEGLENIFG